MSIGLLVITDGRTDYLIRCLASAEEHLDGALISERWMFDDTGDPEHRAMLRARFPDFTHINAGPRQGFGGAIRAAWEALSSYSHARWVFHLEGDFTFNRPVDLAGMADVLRDRPHLVQMVLRRQAWSADERAAGGVIERHAGAYTEQRDEAGHVWLEHRLFFSTNPSLYRLPLCRTGWPTDRHSEGVMGIRLLEHGADGTAAADLRFGYWGSRTDLPWVEHIGLERVGSGY